MLTALLIPGCYGKVLSVTMAIIWHDRQADTEMQWKGPQPLWSDTCTQTDLTRSGKAAQTFDSGDLWNLEAIYRTKARKGCHECRWAQLDQLLEQVTRLREEVSRLREAFGSQRGKLTPDVH